MLSTIMMCLSLNVYFEARNQPLEGQIAVTMVVLNRVSDPQYPNDVCSVVFQAKKDSKGNVIRDQCQFSWYCDGKSDQPTDRDAFRWASYVALGTLYGAYNDMTKGATHYHSNTVKPKWALTVEKTVEIGDHLFFKQRRSY